MAERAAHTTSEVRYAPSAADQPSIFDILAQESLMSGLRPAARHLSRFLSWSYPNLCSGLSRYFDEWYTLTDLLLQNYYLKNYSASFAENFYDIKRVAARTGENISAARRWPSLLCLVIVPYIRLKLDQLYERMKNEQERRKITSEKYRRLIDAFVYAYPIINAALEFWTLILQAGYLISKTSVHSPWLLFAGVRLQRLTPEDYTRFGSSILAPLPLDASIWTRLVYALRRLSSALFRFLSKLLGVGLLLVQFLDYWQTTDVGSNKQLSHLLLPTPSAPQMVLAEQNVVRMDPGVCPICRKKRENDAVLSVSGYIYCYVCIAKYLQKHHCCPVTKIPASTEHLIRLFIQTA